MSTAAFADGIATSLRTDATLLADLLALLGRPVSRVIRGNLPMAQIPEGNYPCWVLEQGDGLSKSIGNDDPGEGQVIGLASQQFTSELYATLVWKEQDRERTALQRAALPDIIARWMLRNPMPGDINGAWLQGWQPDRGMLHPTQCWRATLYGQYEVYQ